MKEDTIIALATPPGVGAISVIRLSGKDAIEITDLFFEGRTRLVESESHRAHYGKLVSNEFGVIDDVIATVYISPNSYTGENSVEISCHGNPFIVQNIINLFIGTNKVRLAEPGEFTKRAFLNNKIDLSQAEAVIDLIYSRTEASFKGARNQLDGLLSKKVDFLRKSIVNTLSYIELELDFAEEDVEFVNRNDLIKMLDEIIIEIDSLLESYNVGKVIRDGVNVALVGKPNVGKSSILNYLLKESRAIVSDIPGTTRDVIREEISIDGILFRLFDTAGLRDSSDVIEKEGILRSRETVKNADLVLFIEDVEQGESQELYKELLNYTKPERIIKVINKIDIDPNTNLSGDVKISAKTGSGFQLLTKKLVESAFGGNYYTEKSVLVSNIRHYNCLKKSREYLLNAHESIIKNFSGEFVSVDLRNAAISLGEIIGEVTNDDILNNIFMQFCIGK
ncbi:MAG: tRNA uridine-5-carboxymethylaminomethyl(34) synthesis GTPase MnmE [Ignavibacterium sp.]|nr:tRNA uridine-5-carboxymethylaminomethyl(34) synthesis GTPase MnmE [Ignavibacterium sp.]MDW8375256.1 tRNA uridine-5-carboxymethylaminomethyl(34) synthesis GTPase MnmE [Ignavibacteriales bacterium]